MTANSKIFVTNPYKSAALYSGEVIGVWVDKDSDVVWSGYHAQDGSFVATGYTIIKKMEIKE